MGEDLTSTLHLGHISNPEVNTHTPNARSLQPPALGKEPGLDQPHVLKQTVRRGACFLLRLRSGRVSPGPSGHFASPVSDASLVAALVGRAHFLEASLYNSVHRKSETPEW